jgi:hypothetical protein
MHVIPQSWSHLHILVSVFPSVGLLFVLGFYVIAFVIDNETMKRACLALFGILGLLAIPTYISGDHSMDALSQNPKISQNLMSSHFGWSVVALFVLVLTSVVAWIELLRSWRVGRLSNNAAHLVLGLAIVTLAFMVFGGESGWQISHNELRLDAAAQRADMATPQWWSHIHMILNHFPTVGFVFALGFFILALILNNDVLKRSSLVLFVICALLIVPTYVTGAASMWALTAPVTLPGISKAVINAHRDMALWTLFGLSDHHSGHHGRNRTPRRADQSSRDPRGDRYIANGSKSGRLRCRRDTHQQRHLVCALANHTFLWLLLDIRHGVGCHAARAGFLEIRAVLRCAPVAPLGIPGSDDECFYRHADVARRYLSLRGE